MRNLALGRRQETAAKGPAAQRLRSTTRFGSNPVQDGLRTRGHPGPLNPRWCTEATRGSRHTHTRSLTILGQVFRNRVTGLGFTEVRTAARSPWQNPFVERLIGTIRGECRDHVIVVDERHLKRILGDDFTDYHSWRTHLSSEMNRPGPREIQATDRGRADAPDRIHFLL